MQTCLCSLRREAACGERPLGLRRCHTRALGVSFTQWYFSGDGRQQNVAMTRTLDLLLFYTIGYSVIKKKILQECVDFAFPMVTYILDCNYI